MSDHYNQYCQNPDKKITRVHINPNFNKSDNTNSSNNMYINPKFSHDPPNLHHNMPEHKASRARIHVNPNFIRNANVFNPIVPNSTKQAVSTSPSSSMKQDSKELNQASFMHVTKSRYCLVRQKENLNAKAPNLKSVTNTVRVNKYKSVSINVVKHNLAIEKPTKITIDSAFPQKDKYRAGCKTMIAPTNNTRYKFVKTNNAHVLSQTQAKSVTGRRYSLIDRNKIAPRKINNKLALKKNNIPCPLFKKYGACLRKIKGNCEYLHDSKHVSICRKFLKGICHNENCLLSHDLTDKKMPTCYFYLQGACTKECCPYLHVKLNEKTKICHDFIKGYCEKGDSCLFRHINVCRDMALKKDATFSPARKINSVNNLKSRMEWLPKRQEQNNCEKKIEDCHAVEQRYFREPLDQREPCSHEKWDKIKPSRTKLGILPSFIQL